MARCSRVRDTADKQYDDVRSNVASTAIHQRFQSVTSNENSIYFPTSGDIPFTFLHSPLHSVSLGKPPFVPRI